MLDGNLLGPHNTAGNEWVAVLDTVATSPRPPPPTGRAAAALCLRVRKSSSYVRGGLCVGLIARAENMLCATHAPRCSFTGGSSAPRARCGRNTSVNGGGGRGNRAVVCTRRPQIRGDTRRKYAQPRPCARAEPARRRKPRCFTVIRCSWRLEKRVLKMPAPSHMVPQLDVPGGWPAGGEHKRDWGAWECGSYRQTWCVIRSLLFPQRRSSDKRRNLDLTDRERHGHNDRG